MVKTAKKYFFFLHLSFLADQNLSNVLNYESQHIKIWTKILYEKTSLILHGMTQILCQTKTSYFIVYLHRILLVHFNGFQNATPKTAFIYQ